MWGAAVSSDGWSGKKRQNGLLSVAGSLEGSQSGTRVQGDPRVPVPPHHPRGVSLSPCSRSGYKAHTTRCSQTSGAWACPWWNCPSAGTPSPRRMPRSWRPYSAGPWLMAQKENLLASLHGRGPLDAPSAVGLQARASGLDGPQSLGMAAASPRAPLSTNCPPGPCSLRSVVLRWSCGFWGQHCKCPRPSRLGLLHLLLPAGCVERLSPQPRQGWGRGVVSPTFYHENVQAYRKAKGLPSRLAPTTCHGCSPVSGPVFWGVQIERNSTQGLLQWLLGFSSVAQPSVGGKRGVLQRSRGTWTSHL